MKAVVLARALLGSIIAVSGLACATEPPELEDSLQAGPEYCRTVASRFALQHPDDDFIQQLVNGRASSSRMLEAFEETKIKSDAALFLFQLGDEKLIRQLWPMVQQVMAANLLDWEWELPAQAVMCGNYDAIKFLIEGGADVYISRPDVADFMTAAVMNRDERMVRLLFDAGYQRCPVLPNGKSLLDVAKNINFDAFGKHYREHCEGRGAE